MKRLFYLALAIAFGCSNASESRSSNLQAENTETSPCPPEWDLSNFDDVQEKAINDSTTQQLLGDKVWFDIINPTQINSGQTKAYIRNYRTDGTIESEGYALYFEHPVADYNMEGEWKFYDCNQQVSRIQNYKDGEIIKN